MAIEQASSSLNPVALWGAALSTLLALVKFWEIWQARTTIDVSYNFTTNSDIGNEVIIRNLTERPVIITYWELVWLEKIFFWQKQTHGIWPDGPYEDLKLGSHSSTKLSFCGGDHFDWSPNAIGKNKIYILLHIAGKKRPITKLVYEQ